MAAFRESGRAMSVLISIDGILLSITGCSTDAQSRQTHMSIESTTIHQQVMLAVRGET